MIKFFSIFVGNIKNSLYFCDEIRGGVFIYDVDMMENQQLEWKEAWRDEYLKWICGFANAQGGVLVIGKNDNGKLSACKMLKNC
jgi:hypothetical protein